MDEDADQRFSEGFDLVNAGFGLLAAGELDDHEARLAIDLFARAVVIFEQLAPWSLVLADGYHGLGTSYYHRGDYDQAIVELQSAMTIYEQRAPTSPCLAFIYRYLGYSHRSLHNNAQVIVYLEKAIFIWEIRLPGSLVFLASDYYDLAVAHLYQSNMDDCLANVNKAIHILQDHPPTYRSVSCYSTLGNVHYSQGNFTAAVAAYKQALDTAKIVWPVDSGFSAGIRLCMARAHFALGHSEACIMCARTAIANWELIPPQEMAQVARCHLILGSGLLAKGELDDALVSYQRGIGVFEQHAPGSLEVGECFQGAAMVLRMQGEYDQAVVYAAKHISICDSPDAHPVDLARSYIVAGDVFNDHHTYGPAVFCYWKALEILDEQNDVSFGIELYHRLGLATAFLWNHSSIDLLDETDSDESMAKLIRHMLSLE